MDILYQKIIYETDIFNKMIDTYTESVMSTLSNMENDELIRSTYFTESTKENENSKKSESNNKIHNKIKEAINKIFGTNLNTINTGSIPKKINKQLAELDKIKSRIYSKENSEANIAKIELSAPNLWLYQLFIEDVVLSHVEKFTLDKSLKLFGRIRGTGKAIDDITNGIIKMTNALQKGRTDVVNRTDKEIIKIANNNPEIISTTRFVDVDDIEKDKSDPINVNVRNVDKFDNDYKESFDDDAPVLFSAGILTAAALFSFCFGDNSLGMHKPEKIHLQKITIESLYKRVMDMHPEKFVDRISKISKNAASSIGTKANIAGFQVAAGAPAVVSYANKINKLIKVYANFYIALVDFYIRLLKGAIRLES